MKKPAFQPGDWALHKSNSLDSREVEWVSEDGKEIDLIIGKIRTGPVPAKNYTNVGRRA